MEMVFCNSYKDTDTENVCTIVKSSKLDITLFVFLVILDVEKYFPQKCQKWKIQKSILVKRKKIAKTLWHHFAKAAESTKHKVMRFFNEVMKL